MATQKSILSNLQDVAADLGQVVSIRKNTYGEYEVRTRGVAQPRTEASVYFAADFTDAVETVQTILARVQKAQAAEGRRREREYARDLQAALDVAQTLLNVVGCRIECDPLGCVTMYSPKTGQHSLNMQLGNRPVSDLLHHVAGFAEQQTHVR